MNKLISSSFWKILQQYSAYFIKFVVQIVLARILMPEEFGIVAEMTAVVFILERLADGGLGTALIQKKNTEKKDYDTVFTSNLVFSAIIYILLFVASPLIAQFYDQPRLTAMLRVSGISVFFTSFNSIQTAKIYRSYQLMKFFIGSFIAAAISGTIAVALAYSGFGVWSLVIQSVISWIITVIVLQILIKWKPSFYFEWNRFKRLFSFSWKVMVSTLSGTILENLYNLSIGKFYGSETLGYYNRGNLFPSIIVGEIRTAVSTVTFPYLSERQDELTNLVNSVKKVTRICTIIMFPLAAGLAAVSEPLVRVLLTDKWLPCVFFLRMECLFYGSLAISATLGNVLKAVGRSEVLMRLELSKLALTILCIIGLNRFDITILCSARVLIAVIMIIYNAWYSGQIVGYGLKQLWHDIYKPLLLSLTMGLIVYSINFNGINIYISLALKFLLGFAIYTAGVYLVMRNDVSDIFKTFKLKKG